MRKELRQQGTDADGAVVDNFRFTVPEPASLALLVAGLAAVVGAARRRRVR